MRTAKNLKKDLSSRFYQYLEIFTYRSYRLFDKDYFCDVCLVREKDKKRVFVRLQKRWFGLSKKMIKAGQTEPRWIIIRSYNFPQKFEFQRVRKVFNQISKAGGKSFGLIDKLSGADLAINEIRDFKNKIKRLEIEKDRSEKNRKNILELKKRTGLLDAENQALRKELLRFFIPEYRKTIKFVSSQLEIKGEAFFQKQFEKNTWIFGPNYEEVIPKKKADPKNEPDFVLKRHDGFSDIVEIEKPSKPLFTKPNKSGKSQPTALLIQAIAQAMDYIESHNQKYKDMFYDDSQKGVAKPIHAYYPRGIVIIGRDESTDRKKLRQLNSFLHHIYVLTYDEFLAQSKRMLEMVEKQGSS